MAGLESSKPRRQAKAHRAGGSRTRPQPPAGIPIDGKRYTVSGEVSRVCDDWNDNCWLEPRERFCTIEEDDPALHHLVHEYPRVSAPV